ncbi:type II toxin-antitoxin system YafQ family toxin [Streptococcus sp. P25B114]
MKNNISNKVHEQIQKSYKLMKKRGYDLGLLEEIITKLSQGIPLEDKHQNHMLTGNFSGYYECHIIPDWLLIYLIENDILTLTLIDTGTHSDLF